MPSAIGQWAEIKMFLPESVLVGDGDIPSSRDQLRLVRFAELVVDHREVHVQVCYVTVV